MLFHCTCADLHNAKSLVIPGQQAFNCCLSGAFAFILLDTHVIAAALFFLGQLVLFLSDIAAMGMRLPVTAITCLLIRVFFQAMGMRVKPLIIVGDTA